MRPRTPPHGSAVPRPVVVVRAVPLVAALLGAAVTESSPAAEAPSLLAPTPTATGSAPAPLRWGATGHRMAARAAVARLPDAMPLFFRAAGDQLVWLNPEPDRWRSRDRAAMDQAWSYDHYIDLENVPAGALDAPDRFTYLAALYRAGLEKPERDAGFLPYRILELYQRIVTGWRLWHEAPPRERRWIEERIVNDAGILGHYVTDASQPHHTTIHFNGWAAGAPNPRGYTLDRGFHGRFETQFVDRHVEPGDLDAALPAVGAPPPSVGDPWTYIMEHVRASHREVETLYGLDRDVGFDPEAPADPQAREFAARRLAAGVEALRALWWAAWLEGGGG